MTFRLCPRHFAIAASLAVALASTPTLAQAPDPAVAAEARAHFERGLTLLNAQNFEGALAEFERSYQLSPRPSVLYNIGVTLQALNRYPEAARAIERYLREATNLPAARRAEVERALEQLRALIAHVRIEAEPAGAIVRVDGVEVGTAPLAQPVEVGPGRHLVEVIAGGQTIGREEFSIASGQTREVRIAPSAPVQAPTPPVPAEGPTLARTAALSVRGAPRDGTIELDGRPIAGERAIHVEPGEHSIVVRAPGRATWRGSVTLGAGESREIRVHLLQNGGLPPGLFFAGAATTLVLGTAATVTGILTLQARSEFVTLAQDSPELSSVIARGEGLRTATNVLLVGTGVFGALTLVLLTRTRFTPALSRADIAVGPMPGGAAASLHLRF